jgi:hypothetical protein
VFLSSGVAAVVLDNSRQYRHHRRPSAHVYEGNVAGEREALVIADTSSTTCAGKYMPIEDRHDFKMQEFTHDTTYKLEPLN